MHAELAKLDQKPTAQIPASEKANFQPDQRDSAKGNYIGVWGDGLASLVAPPGTVEALASAYLGLPF